MAYTLPNFNLLCSWWASGLDPVTVPDPPSQIDLPCQMYVNPKQSVDGVGGNIVVLIRAPTGVPRWQNDVLFECPQGSGVWFTASGVGMVHMGFVNEYRVAVCYPSNNMRVPGLSVTLPLA